MTDREKVMKGLECCILRDPDDHARCSQCPYGSNCVNRLKMDALSLLKAQGWISVKDRLPKSIVNKVLVWLEHDDLVGYIGFGHYEKYKGQEIWFDLEHSEAFSVRGYTVTHWMPLPEPPKEG